MTRAMPTPPSLYKTLGIRRTATADSIRAAYRKAAFKHHPDRNPGDESAATRFHAIKLAFDVLSDPARRAKYDATGEIDAPQPDNRHAGALEALSQTLAGVVKQIVEQGGKVEHEDLVAHMGTVLTSAKVEFTKQRASVVKVRDALKATAGRFGVEGEPEHGNLLESIVAAHVADAERCVQRLDGELAKVKAATELLKQYRYRAEVQRVVKQVAYGNMWTNTSTASSSSW